MADPTQEDLKRYRDQLADRVWRLNSLYWIKNKEGKPVRFKLSWAQRLLMKNRHNLNTILKVRQLGMSTLLAIYILDKLLFTEDFQAGIIDYSLDDAKKKLEKILFAWDNLDNADDGNEEAAKIGAIVKHNTGLKKKDGTWEPKTSNAGEIVFTNGSSAWAGTSLRGGTIQLLHISEYGKISFKEPDKAKEIREGALNTVAKGQEVFIESTHEGGKRGHNYEILAMAMENQNKERLSPMDWKYHFFSWYEQPEYTLNPEFQAINTEMARYFAKLKNNYGIDLPPERKAWYASKKREQKEGMLKEYPTVAPEAFEALIEGAIYGGIIADLRAKGRVCEFEPEGSKPFYTSWDIGVSDYTSIWLVQLSGREVLWLDCFEANGREAGFYVNNAVRKWEQDFQMHVAENFLPHDAQIRDKGSNRTYVSYLEDAGLSNVRVVPRTSDIWLGIDKTRDLLKKSTIHSRCGESKKVGGLERPSALDNLEGYRTKKETGETVIREAPVHDQCSHTADGMRTFAEAYDAGMVGGLFNVSGRGKDRLKVNTGISSSSRRSSNYGRVRVIR